MFSGCSVDIQDDREGMRLSSNGGSRAGVWVCGEPKALGEIMRQFGSGAAGPAQEPPALLSLCLWSSQGRGFK